MAAGTFDKAILSSGSTSRVFDTTIASGIAADLLSALRLDDPDGLRTVPADRILDVQNDIVDHDIGHRNLPGGRSWGVVLDGAVLPRDPQQAVADGAVAHIPLLIGANRDETRVFQVITGDAFGPRDEESLLEEMRRAGVAGPDALLDAYRRRVPGAPLAELRASFLTDAVYRRPATQLAAAQAAAGGRAWSYLFAAEPAGPALGAFHGADLMFLFDKLALIGADTPDHRAAQEALLRAWADFAASGDPGWPAYDPGTAGSTGTTGSARAIGGPETMVTEPPADDVTARWDC
jgi:para-nitrobenzyl esterase